MNHALENIVRYIKEKGGPEFAGNRPSMLEGRVDRRMSAVGLADYDEYLDYLVENPNELKGLITELTINISRFFRNPLTFELIADRILPALLREKNMERDRSLRVWSVGCARGEEPYSLAILIQELFAREKIDLDVHIFASDIDERVLKDAKRAVYPPDSLDNIRHRLLTTYFTPEGASFRLNPEIKKMVNFTWYDIQDEKHRVPPESVFGNFDLVLCCNLSIYFNIEYQKNIFERLLRSLAPDGYLILGEAEAIPVKYRHLCDQVFDFSPIYRKR